MKEYAIIHYPTMGGPRALFITSDVSEDAALKTFRRNHCRAAIVLLVAPLLEFRKATKKYGNN